MLNYTHTAYGVVEQEVCYLVDNVLEDSNQFYFDFQQFNLINTEGEVVGSSSTVQSIFLSLVHNLYFRGLIVENYRFDKDAFASLAHLLSYKYGRRMSKKKRRSKSFFVTLVFRE